MVKELVWYKKLTASQAAEPFLLTESDPKYKEPKEFKIQKSRGRPPQNRKAKREHRVVRPVLGFVLAPYALAKISITWLSDFFRNHLLDTFLKSGNWLFEQAVK